MKATFENSVNVLVKAYLNDTLQHGNCFACAVGNMIADACGYTYRVNFQNKFVWNERSFTMWDDVFMTPEGNNKQLIYADNYWGNTKAEIDSTGYDWRDLAKIEKAFETAKKGKSKEDRMFNGLMAVVDVLADIHGIDLTTKEKAKELFVKV